MTLSTYENLGPRARAVMDELGNTGNLALDLLAIADDFMIEDAGRLVNYVLDQPFAWESSTEYDADDQIVDIPGRQPLDAQTAERALKTCLLMLDAYELGWFGSVSNADTTGIRTDFTPILRVHIADWQDHHERENAPRVGQP